MIFTLFYYILINYIILFEQKQRNGYQLHSQPYYKYKTKYNDILCGPTTDIYLRTHLVYLYYGRVRFYQ